MARERPGHVHAGQDLVPRQPDAFPEGHHPVRVHGVPAVEEDDLVAFHDRADAEEGREGRKYWATHPRGVISIPTAALVAEGGPCADERLRSCLGRRSAGPSFRLSWRCSSSPST